MLQCAFDLPIDLPPTARFTKRTVIFGSDAMDQHEQGRFVDFPVRQMQQKTGCCCKTQQKVVAKATIDIDPVCGMKIDAATATQKVEHQGRDYFFCCGGCKSRFVTNAALYLPLV
jgi:YHS domain-containing protein